MKCKKKSIIGLIVICSFLFGSLKGEAMQLGVSTYSSESLYHPCLLMSLHDAVRSDSSKKLIFKHRFRYLYRSKRIFHFRVTSFISYEKFGLVVNDQENTTPYFWNKGFLLAINTSGPNPMTILPSIWLSYQRSFEHVDLLGGQLNMVNLGFDICAIKFLSSKLEFIFFMDMSLYEWTADKKFISVLTTGGKIRYNFKFNLSLELSGCVRSGCTGDDCSENSFVGKYLVFGLGLSLNI